MNGKTTVTVSPQFQVVIPSEVRKALGIRVGQKIQMVVYENWIELVPVKPIKSLRGFAKGIDTSVERDGDRA